MVSSLRYTIKNLYNKKDYLHYFNRMIKDYENGKWDFDIRTVVKKVKMELPCPQYVCKKGFSKRLCFTIVDDEIFKKEFCKYMNCYVLPAQELRKNRILARRILFKKVGYFTKYNQDCSDANYICIKCKSRSECELTKKYSKKDDHIYRLTRLFELVYSNLNHGHWANMVDEA